MKHILILLLLLILGCGQREERKYIGGIPPGSEKVGEEGCSTFGGLRAISSGNTAASKVDGKWKMRITITCKDGTYLLTVVTID